jgi:hypothetical protein
MEQKTSTSSVSVWDAITKETPREKGALKWATRKLRLLSTTADLIPVPVLGEMTAVAATALAGVVDVGEKLLRLDFKAAAEEFAVSAAETGLVAIPFVEYAMAGVYGLSNGRINPRERARHTASRFFCNACGTESRLFDYGDASPETRERKTVPGAVGAAKPAAP